MLRNSLLQNRSDELRALVARLMANQSKLQPLWRAALTALLGAKVLQLDSTEAGGAKCRSLWACVGDGQTALYLYRPADPTLGGGWGPEHVLARRQGYVVADTPRRRDAQLQRQGLVECGCNLRARRYFLKAQESGDARARIPLVALGKLYEVEKNIHGRAPDAKHAERQRTSKPLYDDLVNWCAEYRRYEPPLSPLGQAINHVLDHETELRRFLDDGDLPIDNGIFERLRANEAWASHLMSSEAGGQSVAVACTVLSCCQLAEVRPDEYLADVLPRLSRGVPPSDVAELLPARWKAAA
jgi:hypothetical protein